MLTGNGENAIRASGPTVPRRSARRKMRSVRRQKQRSRYIIDFAQYPWIGSVARPALPCDSRAHAVGAWGRVGIVGSGWRRGAAPRAALRSGDPQHRPRLPMAAALRRRPKPGDEARQRLRCPDQAATGADPAVQPERGADRRSCRLDRLRQLHPQPKAAFAALNRSRRPFSQFPFADWPTSPKGAGRSGP